MLPQYLLPQHAASRFVKRLALIEQPAIKSFLIRRFLASYSINLEEAIDSDASRYKNFNAFFTRQLKPGVRPVVAENHAACCPADGVISQFGKIENGALIQAKGRQFSANELLAESTRKANRYQSGSFATIYLAPHNYHRVHAPFSGEIISARYVPGKLFSVNQRTAATVDRLFARNERVLVELQTETFGRVMVVMVGALLVASVGLSFFDMESFIYAAPRREPVQLPLANKPLSIEKAQEIGWFNMGSTVVLLFEDQGFTFSPNLTQGQTVRMGEALGNFRTP